MEWGGLPAAGWGSWRSGCVDSYLHTVEMHAFVSDDVLCTLGDTGVPRHPRPGTAPRTPASCHQHLPRTRWESWHSRHTAGR